MGLHINELKTQHLVFIGRVRPAVNLLLNPKKEQAFEIKSRSPESKLIGRPYIRDGDFHQSYLGAGTAEGARQAGKNAAQLCLDHRISEIDAWLILNEPPVATIEQVRLLAEFDAEFARAMSRGGSKACIGAFSRGTPEVAELGGAAILNAYTPTLRTAYDVGAWLAIHQYGKYPLLHEAEYLALRWQTHTLPYYRRQGVPIPRYVVTEFGLDLGIGIDPQDKDGWRATPYSANPIEYGNQLLRLAQEYAKDPDCLGATIFCAGYMGWQSFAVDGPLLDYLATLPWPRFGVSVPAPTPQPAPKPEVPVSAIPAKPPIEWVASPNYENALAPKSAIVWHHTGGSLQATLNHFLNSDLSSHYIIAKTGRIYQMVADDAVAYHAGYSMMPDGRENVNRFAYGFELENAGDGKDPYPEPQIAAAVALARHLVAKDRIPRSGNVTHELIRRLWKQKYPNRLGEDGRIVSYKNDPRGLDMTTVLNRVYAPLPVPVPTPKPGRAPLPEDELLNPNLTLKMFLEKATYWAEEELRQYADKKYLRASNIRASLAKLLAAGRDRWST